MSLFIALLQVQPSHASVVAYRVIALTGLITGILSVLWFIYLAILYRRELRRDSLGLCMRCGYDLRHNSGRCPECGQPVPRTSGATRHV